MFLNPVVSTKETARSYASIDRHKNSISPPVVGQDRSVEDRQRFACSNEARIRKYFPAVGAIQAVVEATVSYEWLLNLMELWADRLVHQVAI